MNVLVYPRQHERCGLCFDCANLTLADWFKLSENNRNELPEEILEKETLDYCQEVTKSALTLWTQESINHKRNLISRKSYWIHMPLSEQNGRIPIDCDQVFSCCIGNVSFWWPTNPIFNCAIMSKTPRCTFLCGEVVFPLKLIALKLISCLPVQQFVNFTSNYFVASDSRPF